MNRTKIGAAVAVGLSALIISPAYAEGSWSGKWSAVFPGMETRYWADRDTDSAHTVVKFRNCTYDEGGYSFKNLQARLMYNNTWSPDETLGSATWACRGSGWMQFDFGRQKAGDHFVVLDKVDGRSRAYARINADVAASY